MFANVPTDEYPFLLLVLIFFIVAWKKGGSKFTLFEIAVLGVWHVLDNSVSFFSYYTAKLILSFILFFFFTDSSNPQLRQLAHLGFKPDKFHAGITYGPDPSHYAFPSSDTHVDSKEKDASFGLVPQRVVDEKVKKAFRNSVFKVPCGFAYEGILNEEIIQLLQSCGRCHNWALMALYQLSADKFYSLSMLSLWRWDAWVLICLAVIAVPCLNFRGDGDRAGPLLDVCFLALAFFDKINRDKTRLLDNKRRKKLISQFYPVYELCKLAMLMILWYQFVKYAVPLLKYVTLQFFALLAMSLIITAFMRWRYVITN